MSRQQINFSSNPILSLLAYLQNKQRKNTQNLISLTPAKMKHGEVIIVVYDVVLVVLSIALIILGVLLFLCCKKKRPAVEDDGNGCHKAAKLSAAAYTLTEMDAATDGFNPRRIIGKGRLGVVYSGVLPEGRGELVAVKRFHPRLVLSNAGAGFGFSSLLRWLSLADHPNLVPILGFSEAPGERIVLMEYGGMLSLEFYLHQNPDAAALLHWPRRVKVAAGVARGLEFLHEGMAPHIVHGCVKGSNVLIDVEFCARLCDYGLYFLASNERQEVVGYVDEEYWGGGGGGSKESDVYGFGVVLLELLSGRKSQEGLLVKWALPLLKEMKFGEVLDPRLEIPCDINPLVRLAKVASACVGNSRKSRPTIVQVAAILNNLEIEFNL
ncbi:proline-rich receptor-like protein kinase PERK15 [Ipomoea triloba]|uniref:proline-rich receptor-like protein kinase PERK15 n=1 Tax=Ipomoea triloba TaxID=35885 RepID=UPI00125E4982|nr:proline-rich receptor-like protein kinase PERK15 [Ipomoea triloba]